MLTQLAQAIRRLHREKSEAYGNAWKKRGEVMSVLANIARKVDRITTGGETRDEVGFDTAVDLLVYAIKYQTFVADQDATVASALHLAGVSAPYSDGTAGFDVLLDGALARYASRDAPRIAAAITEVDRAFGILELDFDAAHPLAPPARRAEHADLLVRAATALVNAITVAEPRAASRFIAIWGSDDDED